MFTRFFLLFLAIPFVELYLFLVVGREIGPLPTLAAIVLTSLLGVALARSQGMRILVKYREAMAQGRLPAEAVIDGLLILLAGVLLIVPGFFTDIVGILLLAPPLRKLARSRVEASLRSRFRVVGAAEAAAFASARGAPRADRDGVITVEAEVVESHAYGDVSGKP